MWVGLLQFVEGLQGKTIFMEINEQKPCMNFHPASLLTDWTHQPPELHKLIP